MGTARTRLGKLAALSPREWTELLQAQGALLWAQVLVWTRPTGRLVANETAAPEHGREPARPPDAADPRAPRLALAVGRAAENGLFRPLCLVQAVALNRMLERRRIHGSRIRIGVRMRNGRFAAHAWVEYAGRVLGDPAELAAQFDDLTDVRVIDAS